MTQTRTVEFTCNADLKLFTDEYDDLPKEWREIIEEQQGLACDGGGVPGCWCHSCYWFGGEEDLDD